MVLQPGVCRRGAIPAFCGGEGGAERSGRISAPPPLVSCGCGFIVASAPLTPASHLAGEAVASWDLPTQPGNGSVKIRRGSPTASQI